MPYKPVPGGYNHRRKLADGHTAARQIRQLIAAILQEGPTQAVLYQHLTAIALLTTKLDDVLNDLAAFTDPE